MKVEISVGEEMRLEFQIPDDTKYSFVRKVLRNVQSISTGEKMFDNFKEFMEMNGEKAFVDTDETLNFPSQELEFSDAENCTECSNIGCLLHPGEE